MDYEPLSKIYRKDLAAHGSIYQQRFNSPTTKHFDFPIREFDRKVEYPAFFCYTEEFVLLSEKIYEKRAALVKTLKKIPEIVLRQFMFSCAINEVKASNEIEGINSTRRELREALESVSGAPRFASIVRKYTTLLSAEKISFATCSDVRKFYDDFAHKEVVADNADHELDGALFRKGSVEIEGYIGKTIHKGVSPEERIIELLDVALKVLNDEKIPLLVRVAVFHYFFEYVHPFYDGNGRTARFIVSYFLAEKFNLFVALRLSAVIKRRRKNYYKLFREADSEINCGELTHFVQGFTEMISTTFDDIEFNLKRKMEQLSRYRAKLSGLIKGDKVTRDLYEILLQSNSFFGQGVSMEDLMTLLKKSRNTIMTRIKAAPAGHIIKSGGKKIFYKLDMKIFKAI